uniref:Uncharacterized protein n=1 Tax=Leersia perrieri TaxID=77586 RepID=A0A0D9WZN7_9ORYZ
MTMGGGPGSSGGRRICGSAASRRGLEVARRVTTTAAAGGGDAAQADPPQLVGPQAGVEAGRKRMTAGATAGVMEGRDEEGMDAGTR